MNKQSTRAKPEGSIESIKISNIKCFDYNTDDFGYLIVRREWSRRFPSEVQLSNHEGTVLYQPVGASVTLYSLKHGLKLVILPNWNLTLWYDYRRV